jgi:hypothetical protein
MIFSQSGGLQKTGRLTLANSHVWHSLLVLGCAMVCSIHCHALSCHFVRPLGRWVRNIWLTLVRVPRQKSRVAGIPHQPRAPGPEFQVRVAPQRLGQYGVSAATLSNAAAMLRQAQSSMNSYWPFHERSILDSKRRSYIRYGTPKSSFGA